MKPIDPPLPFLLIIEIILFNTKEFRSTCTECSIASKMCDSILGRKLKFDLLHTFRLKFQEANSPTSTIQFILSRLGNQIENFLSKVCTGSRRGQEVRYTSTHKVSTNPIGNVWVLRGIYSDSRPILFPFPNFRKKLFPLFSVVRGKIKSLRPAKNRTYLRSGSLAGPRLFANFTAGRRIGSRSGTPLSKLDNSIFGNG